MSLHTFEVYFDHEDRKGRYMRLLTSTPESVGTYMDEHYPGSIVTSIKQEPDRAHYCEHCGSKLGANFL